MKKNVSRRGSALLIVLGMLSFMLISALAFASYMRYARLPSSYLRRTSSVRLLAKAAVAEAIDEIDLAVANNVHPGLGDSSIYDSSRQRTTNRRNVWCHRVYMGTDQWKPQDMDETLSPLCMEALAYIPPPLVNEARYYSRMSQAAKWHSFAFDAGRYCFCALDVSDFFDINRLLADVPRSSAAPRRITLSYLFENKFHTELGSDAATWDQFMSKYRGDPDENSLLFDFKSHYPFISLADFNLALGTRGKVAGFWSPFYDYAAQTGTEGRGILATRNEDKEQMDRVRRMTFVTDGWFPESASEKEEDRLWSLCDGTHQPFSMQTLATKGGSQPNPSVHVFGSAMQDKAEWLKRLSGLGCAALFDYLDTDHVPLSLAIPTTERVPMVCGVKPLFPGSKIAVKKEVLAMTGENGGEIVEADDGTRIVEQTVRYQMDNAQFGRGFMSGGVEALTVFPFSHPDEDDSKSFKIDGRFSLFFSSEQMSLRTGSQDDVLHLSSQQIPNTGIDTSTGLISVKLDEQEVAVKNDIKSQKDALSKTMLQFRAGNTISTMFSVDGNELLRVKYRWKQHRLTNTGGVTAGGVNWVPSLEEVMKNEPDKLIEVKTVCRAVDASGVPDGNFSDPGKLLQLLQAGYGSGPTVYLNAAVWLRIKADGKVVDMVPACILDDKGQNGANIMPQLNIVAKQFSGDPYPLMRFDTGVSFKLSVEEMENGLSKDVTVSPEAVVVADPRFNHAPENWFTAPGELGEQAWLDSCQVGKGTRDGDIFMATSDAGYMQSIWELAMLPRFTNLKNFGDEATRGNLASLQGATRRNFPSSFEDCAQRDHMWQTYDPFDRDEEAFADLPWTDGGTGFRINPYSDSTNVVMAAFANTPVDWKRCSTNDQGTVDFASMKASEFNKKYAFNKYSQDTQVSWDFLAGNGAEGVAGRFMRLVRQERDWVEAWQKMGWYYDENKFCGVEMDNETDDLWTCDRKFLYGYWRECFAARQQLYMVFVRAEPVMMGVGSGGDLPPQLGARAMALVWRDPAKAKDPMSPHQTRILFYRQFD